MLYCSAPLPHCALRSLTPTLVSLFGMGRRNVGRIIGARLYICLVFSALWTAPDWLPDGRAGRRPSLFPVLQVTGVFDCHLLLHAEMERRWCELLRCVCLELFEQPIHPHTTSHLLRVPCPLPFLSPSLKSQCAIQLNTFTSLVFRNRVRHTVTATENFTVS